ncbi:hypothetical protein E8E12_000815 [Didymella heteroderae]|uniref:Uncharacterized protein n=1 Tax=Didymella heteroderae TaxID=1769908 RepID=A0A9P5BVE7_9PLEO|nr:hypothetical protein E8E12_000815 [Didymella heteroderae]
MYLRDAMGEDISGAQSVIELEKWSSAIEDPIVTLAGKGPKVFSTEFEDVHCAHDKGTHYVVALKLRSQKKWFTCYKSRFTTLVVKRLGFKDLEEFRAGMQDLAAQAGAQAQGARAQPVEHDLVVEPLGFKELEDFRAGVQNLAAQAGAQAQGARAQPVEHDVAVDPPDPATATATATATHPTAVRPATSALSCPAAGQDLIVATAGKKAFVASDTNPRIIAFDEATNIPMAGSMVTLPKTWSDAAEEHVESMVDPGDKAKFARAYEAVYWASAGGKMCAVALKLQDESWFTCYKTRFKKLVVEPLGFKELEDFRAGVQNLAAQAGAQAQEARAQPKRSEPITISALPAVARAPTTEDVACQDTSNQATQPSRATSITPEAPSILSVGTNDRVSLQGYELTAGTYEIYAKDLKFGKETDATHLLIRNGKSWLIMNKNEKMAREGHLKFVERAKDASFHTPTDRSYLEKLRGDTRLKEEDYDVFTVLVPIPSTEDKLSAIRSRKQLNRTVILQLLNAQKRAELEKHRDADARWQWELDLPLRCSPSDLEKAAIGAKERIAEQLTKTRGGKKYLDLPMSATSPPSVTSSRGPRAMRASSVQQKFNDAMGHEPSDINRRFENLEDTMITLLQPVLKMFSHPNPSAPTSQHKWT